MPNVTNYYSVTDNIFQLIVDFWHMLLVNDDDDVMMMMSVSHWLFCTTAMFCIFLKIFLFFFVSVWVCA